MTHKSVNKSVLLITTLLMWAGISNVQAAQVVNDNITNHWPNSRYTVHNNGTITDTDTGLMWQQCSDGQTGDDCSGDTASTHTWQQALQLAAKDTTAGYNDWRLPNIKELASLVAYDRYRPSINEDFFPNTAIATYWSSSPYVSAAGYSNVAWLVNFNDGNVYNYYRGNYNRVRLVRSGQ